MPPELLSLYPLSSPSGDSIPYDIIRPRGLIKQDFTDTVSGSISIPTDAEILACWASNDCLIRFGAAASYPANGVYTTNLMLIPGNTFINIDHNGATTFTVIGIRSPGGVLFVVCVDKWKDLRKPIQFNKI